MYSRKQQCGNSALRAARSRQSRANMLMLTAIRQRHGSRHTHSIQPDNEPEYKQYSTASEQIYKTIRHPAVNTGDKKQYVASVGQKVSVSFVHI